MGDSSWLPAYVYRHGDWVSFVDNFYLFSAILHLEMSVTKIINVLKNDGFEDIFDLFKNTDADEVIFIFPKGSRLAKQEQYFKAIKSEADLLGKRLSVMTADPLIIQFASKYGFDILEVQSPGRKKLQLLEPAETIYPEPAEGDYPISLGEEGTANEEPETILAAAEIDDGPEEDGQSRMIKDILPSGADRNLEVRGEKERTFEVDVKSYVDPVKSPVKSSLKEFHRGTPKELFDRVERPKGRVGDIGKIWAEEEERKRRSFFNGPVRKLKSHKLFRKIPLLLTVGAALVLVLVLYLTLGSVQIIIRPQRQELNFKLKVSASSAATAVNFNFNQIPGQHFKDQKEESGVFSATGQKDIVQKASGKITIFNKSFTAQRLVATTRFKSPGGLIFRIPQTITVPLAIKAGSAVTPGSVESVVYADRPGAEYNIAPTQFTIPGFEGSSKFNDFYAVSDKPMAGGIIGPAKVVTEEDFAKAQESLAAKVKDEILKSLKSQSGELKIIDALAVKLEAPNANAKVGDAVENFQMSVKGLADTVAFREADITELIKNFVSQKKGLELLSKDLVITYANPALGADGILLSFDVQVNGWAAAKLDKDAILKDVARMNEDSVRSYFQGIKEVESARIILSPFWVRNIPKDPKKIKIEINTD